MKPKRLARFATIGVLLIAALVSYFHFWKSQPIGSGPAGPQVPAAVFSRPWTEKQVFLIGLGDSVTAGFGARRGYSYFDRLAANPPDESEDMKGICLRTVMPNLRVTNIAVSGSTSGGCSYCRSPRWPTSSADLPLKGTTAMGTRSFMERPACTGPRTADIRRSSSRS